MTLPETPDSPNTRPKFKLALCELFCSKLHGGKEIGHYLIIDTFNDLDKITETDSDLDDDDSDTDTESDSSGVGSINDAMWMNRSKYEDIVCGLTRNPHKIIRNYLNIISEPDYIKPEIIKKIKLPSGHRVAILKTYLIRIIQRAWKKVFAKRMEVIERRKMIHNLNYRMYRGTWSSECRSMPGLYGLLVKRFY